MTEYKFTDSAKEFIKDFLSGNGHMYQLENEDIDNEISEFMKDKIPDDEVISLYKKLDINDVIDSNKTITFESISDWNYDKDVVAKVGGFGKIIKTEVTSDSIYLDTNFLDVNKFTDSIFNSYGGDVILKSATFDVKGIYDIKKIIINKETHLVCEDSESEERGND
jgi:hypothetical protein